jgi:hypothetical protein
MQFPHGKPLVIANVNISKDAARSGLSRYILIISKRKN